MCSELLANAKFSKSAQTSITISHRSELDTEAKSHRTLMHSLQMSVHNCSPEVLAVSRCAQKAKSNSLSRDLSVIVDRVAL
eukprot:3941077-Rhodomonas_salina.2